MGFVRRGVRCWRGGYLNSKVAVLLGTAMMVVCSQFHGSRLQICLTVKLENQMLQKKSEKTQVSILRMDIGPSRRLY